jgi:hypothetical protein|nr:hypothetical protein [uncultured Flavobacterium sp.]
MKWFKKGIISCIIILFFFFAFYKSDRINLDGKWEAKEIVLDGKKLYPDLLANFIDFPPEIIINGWTKSISIPIKSKNISVRFEYTEKVKNKLKLFSREKLLNGDFNLVVDTTGIGPRAYIVDVIIKSRKVLIHFRRKVIIPPWKPEFPKRGQV